MTTAAAQPRRRQPPDVRREQLLDAAERVLLQRGLAAATMADVAEAAAVAKGTVYLYYPSKAELLAGLRDRFFERFVATLDDGAAPRGTRPTWAARVQRLVAAAYDFALANHELYHVLFHHAGFGEDHAFGRARAAIAELVEGGVAAGEFRLADPALATDFLLHALHGTLAAASHQPRSQRQRFVEGVGELARRALGAGGG
jgi:TetR/AcrR family transcriptional repressor of nem operon